MQAKGLRDKEIKNLLLKSNASWDWAAATLAKAVPAVQKSRHEMNEFHVGTVDHNATISHYLQPSAWSLLFASLLLIPFPLPLSSPINKEHAIYITLLEV